ncbi:hypothetical protein ACFL4E_00560 [Candidatus Omnitrophota bacterium]
MKKLLNWRLLLGVFLILLSAQLYLLHYIIFHDTHHIFIYLLGDIAFVPVEVLIVTLIIHQLLEKREKRNLLRKLNMLVGAFYSDVGTELLRIFTGFDPNIEQLRVKLKVDNKWSAEKFEEMKVFLKKYSYDVDSRTGDLDELRDFLSTKTGFLLNLLANPNLLEHESFTELLWAIFHLAEELGKREDFSTLPALDLDHISGDIKRAYKTLSLQWLDYTQHLKKEYPYLFSLAVRSNPFELAPSAVIAD